MILLLGVNSRHITFFKKIEMFSKCKVEIVSSKKIFKFSIRNLRYLDSVNLKSPIDLKVKDFFARYDNSLIPKTLIFYFYKILALFYYMRYSTIINNRYTKIVVWNGVTFRQAIAIEIAKLYNIEPIYIENGFLPNRVVIDRKGVNFYNSVPRDIEFYRNYRNIKTLPKELIPRNPKNIKKFLNSRGGELPKRYIFIPFQVDYDTQIMLFSPWIENMRELFYIIENISKKLDIDFVFKEHPSSRKSYHDIYKKIDSNPKLYLKNEYSTQELIQKSEAVITINSSVGVESLLYHKKVFVLGKAFYKIDGITIGIDNEVQLLESLKNLDNIQIDFNIVDNFLKYLYYDYLIEGNFIDYNRNQIKQIEKILECKGVKSV